MIYEKNKIIITYWCVLLSYFLALLCLTTNYKQTVIQEKELDKQEKDKLEWYGDQNGVMVKAIRKMTHNHQQILKKIVPPNSSICT